MKARIVSLLFVLSLVLLFYPTDAFADEEQVLVTGITISSMGDTTTINQGETLQLSAAVAPDNATVQTVTWSSNAESIATVDADGLVTAESAGIATITATANDGSVTHGELVITVNAVLAGSIEIIQSDTSIPFLSDTKVQLEAIILPDNALDKSVHWSVTNAGNLTGQASIDATGLLSCIRSGTVTVTASANDGSGVSTSSDFTITDFIGSGTSESPFQITRKHQLKCFNGGNNDYILMNDIEFSEADFAEGGDFYNNGYGYRSIGPFSGVFDGNGHAIRGLHQDITVRSLYREAGLFGSVIGGIIKNLRMENCYFKGYASNSDVSNVGSVAGKIDEGSIIVGCSSVNNLSVGGFYTGGIVGYAGNNCEVKNCYNTSNIANSNCSGGIVGYLYGYSGKSVISRCYNTGNIANDNNWMEMYSRTKAGGISGNVYYAIVYDCFNTGNIGPGYGLGGIAGSMLFSSIRNCYNIGCVGGSEYAGGIVGFGDESNKVLGCYYLDRNAVGVAYGQNAAVSVSIDALLSSDTFGAFDFDAVWTMEGNDAFPYPELKENILNDTACNIAFDTQGGNSVKSIKAQYNSFITQPISSVREGYMFGGWYIDFSCTTPWNFNSDRITGNITLYAKWIALYTVAFDSQGGSNIQSVKVPYETFIEEPEEIPTLPGNTFGGWYCERTCLNAWDFSHNIVYGDITLYAKWTLNTCTVTFDSRGGSDVGSVDTVFNTNIEEPLAPSRTGYGFSGWYDEPDCITLWNFADDKVLADITLYAKWVPITYTVTFDSRGGTSVASRSADFDTSIASPSAPSRTGYSFSGWYKEYTCKTPWCFATDRVYTSVILYAKWTANTYTVAFNAQGGSVSQSSKSVIYGATYGVLPTPTRVGYMFGGWHMGVNGTGSFVTMATIVTTAYIHTLYAKWTINTYTVSFNSQGGTTVTKKTAIFNTALSAPAAPTRTGYAFCGWYREPACAHIWTFPTDKVTANITLYARWIALPAVPAGVKAVPVSYAGVQVSWGAVPNAAAYEVWREAYGAGSYSLAGTTSSTSCTNNGLSTGTKYYYKVRAYRWNGSAKIYGGWSAAVCATPILAAPGSVKAVRASSTSVKLTWALVACAIKYEIWSCPLYGGTYSLTGITSYANYIDTKLTTGKTYYYKVRAYHLEGKVKVYSGYSVIVSAKP